MKNEFYRLKVRKIFKKYNSISTVLESSTRGLERIGHYETGVLYKNEESSVYLKMRVPLKFFFSKNQPGNAVK